jgi:hypothetical protein
VRVAPSIGHAQESDTLLDDPRVLREGNETSKMLFQLPQQERHETMTRFISANGLTLCGGHSHDVPGQRARWR